MRSARLGAPVTGPEQVAPAPSAPAPRPEGGGATVAEIGGPKGPEPTRYGDWERNGRCSDF